MRILVTGGGGFIGRNFIEMSRDRYEIVAPRSGELDLTDGSAVDHWFSKQMDLDVVVHTATTPGHRAASTHHSLLESNLNMYFNLLKHKDRWGKMILLTSGAVYDVTSPIVDASETALGKNIPREPSGLSKLSMAYHAQSQKNVIELRPFGVFGKHELYSIRFISNAICKALLNLPITLRQNRDFSYIFVDDLVRLVQYFCEHESPHFAFNTTNPENYELDALAKTVQEIVNPNVPIKIASQGKGLSYTGSSKRLMDSLPSFKFTEMTDAIAQLANWYRDQISQIDKNTLLEDK